MASPARFACGRSCLSWRGIRRINTAGGNSSIQHIVSRTASGRFPSQPPTSFPRRIPKYLERFRYRLPTVNADGDEEPGCEMPVSARSECEDKERRRTEPDPTPTSMARPESNLQLKKPKLDVGDEEQDRLAVFELRPAVREPKPLATDSIDTRPVVTIAWVTDKLYIEDEQRSLVKELRPAAIRDNCVCRSCRDADSGNKLFESSRIPTDMGIEGARATNDGLRVKLVNDTPGHDETLVPWDKVEVALRRRGAREGFFPRRPSILGQTGMLCWDRDTLQSAVRAIDYEAFMSGNDDDAALWDVIIDLCRLGIVFIRGLPTELGAVEEVTRRIANLRETLYGRVFDVMAGALDQASNVAYSSLGLGLHQDLLYLDPPPQIQVLHCLDNSCPGGDSFFSDSERVARLLWPFVRVSERLSPLATRSVDYHYRGYDYREPPNRYHFYHASRPVLSHDALTGFTRVWWSPPFQAPSQLADQQLEPWIRAARFFEELISDPEAVFRVRLQPGDCVLFDNRRVLHGRDAFDAKAKGCQRWLRGAYIAADDFWSRASQMPAKQAEYYRGPEPWSSMMENQDLRHSQWRKRIEQMVMRFDPGVDERMVR